MSAVATSSRLTAYTKWLHSTSGAPAILSQTNPISLMSTTLTTFIRSLSQSDIDCMEEGSQSRSAFTLPQTPQSSSQVCLASSRRVAKYSLICWLRIDRWQICFLRCRSAFMRLNINRASITQIQYDLGFSHAIGFAIVCAPYLVLFESLLAVCGRFARHLLRKPLPTQLQLAFAFLLFLLLKRAESCTSDAEAKN